MSIETSYILRIQKVQYLANGKKNLFLHKTLNSLLSIVILLFLTKNFKKGGIKKWHKK
jgi:hypothetical protein